MGVILINQHQKGLVKLIYFGVLPFPLFFIPFSFHGITKIFSFVMRHVREEDHPQPQVYTNKLLAATL
jgi:hypothetical protein